ncbi:AAA family ATPase [Rhodococcus artemisiae]|uniref:Nuclease SbcCD subunit C n=1 Tax=Rhodococcus artemisiae TaxID=714159 RepID=A0ABU7LM21_9NOCA|nr:AAA family ATPase [Rhodococcus artemisiae]MEE2062294.1 AAA family ATPase [Rhodococcus artemisiae]
MMSFEPIIQRLRVEAFRGFRDAHEFDLSAAAVVVTGPNGTGKTSFFDALQWGLLGSLERLENLRSRRNVEHVVNQYRIGRKASVEIDLSLPSGPVTVRRIGDQGGSSLELRRPGEATLFGDDAEAELRHALLPRSELSLNSALTTSGLMQQDVMRRVLEAKPADRYRQLSTVLGLEALEDFEDAAKSAAKQASDREKAARGERSRLADALQQAHARLEAAQTRLATRPQVSAVREETLRILMNTPSGVYLNRGAVNLENPDDVSLTAAAFGHAADIVETARTLSRQAAQLRAGLGEEPTEEKVTALRQQFIQAEAARDAVNSSRAAMQEQLNAAQRTAAEVARLAALAVPLLSDHCPVCGQGIDRARVEQELRQRAEATGTLLELQQALTELSATYERAATTAAGAGDALAAAEQEVRRWAHVRSADIAASTAVEALSETIQVVKFDRYDIDAFANSADPVLEYYRRARRSLHELLETFDQHSDQGAVDRASAEIRSLEASLTVAEAQLATESARSQKLQALSAQTLDARVEVTEARLRSIQPLVANIFQRLDPHPAFKTVEFELDTYYRRGTTSPLVIDQVEGVAADPLLIFSTSQANIVALSYFIAMSLSAKERGLPFLLLDDPVQSMDDVNVLGFADLCRHLRRHRQLIVSTHERRFASLLERKLAPRTEDSNTKIIRFTGWDRSGPTISEHFVEQQLLNDPIRLVHLAG